jgi:tetratricopeptide (TPR) repeat protein
MAIKLKSIYYIYIFISIILLGCNVSINQNINELNRLLSENNFAKASKISFNLIQKGIINEEIYSAYGICQFENGNYIESKNYFKMSFELDSTNVKVLYLLGKSYHNIKMLDSAEIYLLKAIKIKGNEHFYIDYNEKSIIKDDIPMKEIRYSRGLVSSEKENYKQALEDFNFCINKSYRKEESLFMLGFCYFNLGFIDDGCKAFKMASDLGDIDALKYCKQYCTGCI